MLIAKLTLSSSWFPRVEKSATLNCMSDPTIQMVVSFSCIMQAKYSRVTQQLPPIVHQSYFQSTCKLQNIQKGKPRLLQAQTKCNCDPATNLAIDTRQHCAEHSVVLEIFGQMLILKQILR